MKLRMLAVTVVLALVRTSEAQQAQVDPAIPSYKPPDELPLLVGEISAAGASEMEKLMGLWTDNFTKLYPNVRFNVPILKGTATGVGPLVAGTAHLCLMGREMWPSEMVGFQFTYGYDPLELAVAYGSYRTEKTTRLQVVAVNKDNPLDKLTLAQLDAIFAKTRKRGYREEITTWSQLGLKGEWANQPIKLYGLDQDSGNGQAFRQMVLLNGRWRDTIKESPAHGKEVAASLAQDRFGIGFTMLDRASIPGVKIVALAEKDGGPYSDARFTDVVSGKYPLTRKIYIYVNRAPGASPDPKTKLQRPASASEARFANIPGWFFLHPRASVLEAARQLDPKVREFLRFVLSKEGQEAVVREGVFLPLPAEVVRQERAKLE